MRKQAFSISAKIKVREFDGAAAATRPRYRGLLNCGFHPQLRAAVASRLITNCESRMKLAKQLPASDGAATGNTSASTWQRVAEFRRTGGSRCRCRDHAELFGQFPAVALGAFGLLTARYEHFEFRTATVAGKLINWHRFTQYEEMMRRQSSKLLNSNHGDLPALDRQGFPAL